MKFSRSLQFNCVPEWSEYYLAFQALKTQIHHLEAARSTAGSEVTAKQLEAAFMNQYTSEINKVVEFYKKMYVEISLKYTELQALVSEWNAVDEDDLKTIHPHTMRRPSLAVGTDLRLFGAKTENPTAAALSPEFPMKFDDKAKEVYLAIHDLHEFLYMNYTGFNKLSKALEKHCENPSAARQLSKTVESSLPMKDLATLDGLMIEIERAYAHICCDSNLDEATVYLRHLLHERIIHERASVWQDMVAAERKAHEITLVSTSPAATTSSSPSKKKPVNYKQIFSLVLCATVYFACIYLPLFKGAGDNADQLRRGLAILLTSALLWCTEALPLYITALFVPFLITVTLKFSENKVVDGVMQSVQLSPYEVAEFILRTMFSKTIMLLFGGFALSAALSKSGVTKSIASSVLSRVGRRPAVVLLSVMTVTTFLCAVLSNVAAPVLVFTIIGPMLRTLGADHPFAKALVLGVAYAANVGGMTTAIASPQSTLTADAVEKKITSLFKAVDPSHPGSPEVGLGTWFFMTLPTCIIGTLLLWAILLFSYPCKTLLPEACILKPSTTPWSGKQYFVAIVSVFTIGLWVASPVLTPIFGPMGMLSVFPLVMFFGAGVLGKDDFNGFAWNVIVLAMGGSALGKAVEVSGLLKYVGDYIGDLLGNLPPYAMLTIFAFSLLIITTFISHTVGALIFLPLIANIAFKKDPEITRIFVVIAGLMCSVGMGMPISGFPNMAAVSQEDATGRNFINTMDFVKTGLLGSFLVYLTVVSVGYGMAKLLL